MVLVTVAGPRVDRLRRIDDALQWCRAVSVVGRLRLILKQAAERLLRRLLRHLFKDAQNFRALLADGRCGEEGVAIDA